MSVPGHLIPIAVTRSFIVLSTLNIRAGGYAFEIGGIRDRVWRKQNLTLLVLAKHAIAISLEPGT